MSGFSLALYGQIFARDFKEITRVDIIGKVRVFLSLDSYGLLLYISFDVTDFESFAVRRYFTLKHARNALAVRTRCAVPYIFIRRALESRLFLVYFHRCNSVFVLAYHFYYIVFHNIILLYIYLIGGNYGKPPFYILT